MVGPEPNGNVLQETTVHEETQGALLDIDCVDEDIGAAILRLVNAPTNLPAVTNVLLVQLIRDVQRLRTAIEAKG